MKTDKAFFSLNEAVTHLAFGKPRTPQEELALRVADQHRLIALIDQCGVEATTSARYRTFPRRLPYYPRTALIDRLEACKASWPPTAKALRAMAVRQEAKWRRYDEAYADALARIVEVAADKKIEAVGQVSRAAGADVRVIPWSDLLGQVTIDYQRLHLGPDTTASGKPRAYAILKCGCPRGGRNYYNAQVNRRQFRAMFKLHASNPPKSRRQMENELKAWFEKRVATWPAGAPPPSRVDDYAAAQEVFGPLGKYRSFLRSQRPKKWRGPGRRKVAKN